jgi:hypothetical protein
MKWLNSSTPENSVPELWDEEPTLSNSLLLLQPVCFI